MDPAWRLRSVDEPASLRLVRDLGIHSATARCLIARGIDSTELAGAFLQPRLANLRSPVGMAGLREATTRLQLALQNNETIGIFGDYDVDGVTAAALVTSFLREVGGKVVVRVAARDSGYGFGEPHARWFAEMGCRVVVTLDCGTSDLPAIEAARACGIDTIVVDHHQVPDRADHPAFALINPHRPDSTFPFRGLASVGLGFYLACALRTSLKQAGWFTSRREPDVRRLLDLVAVGTIADLAPLREENRILVAIGLRELSERKRPGFAALLRGALVPEDRALDEIDVGWRLGPRLNAPGRLGDAQPSLDLLLAKDEVEAAARAAVLEENNLRRRTLQDVMVVEALEEAELVADHAAIVVARAGWHPGVVGIVAAKLVDRYGKAAVVIALDPVTGEGRGSVRSVPGVDAYRALHACRDHVIRYGGHAAAAGLTVAASEIPRVRELFAAEAARAVRPARAVEVDAAISLGDVDDKLAREVCSLAPFGQGNAAPVIVAPRARVTASRRVGDDGSHLKLTLQCGSYATTHSAIAFRMGERDPGVGATVDVAFRPEISLFRGMRRLELNVCAMRLAGQELVS